MQETIIADKKIVLWLLGLIGLIVLVYLFLPHRGHFSRTNEDIQANKASNTTQKTAGVVLFHQGVLSGSDQQAYNEVLSWTTVSVSNQPSLVKNPQSIKLPVGWTAREDYISSVIPQNLPKKVLNSRSIIMRPPEMKSLSREDAIFTISELSDPYFIDRCHKNQASGEILCYGGTNPDTKHVFDLLVSFK